MAYTVQEVATEPNRFLVVVADTAEELSALTSKALAKGWLDQDMVGVDPSTGKMSVWLTKPCAASAAPSQ